MKLKKIEQVLAPSPAHMVGDGFRVHNFFPSGYNLGYYRMSPFFLMDYNSRIEFSPSDRPRGVGVHPHKGFETVTIAYHGKIAHHDSYGNSGVIAEGDLQWMTAGNGLLHKEYHEKEFSKKGGPFQMVQLWVNLPAKDKSTKPKYQPIKHEEMGKHQLPNGNGVVEVIAGKFKNTKGPASTFTPIEMYNIRLKPIGSIEFSLPESYNTGILVVEGSVEVNNTKVPTDHFVLFKNEGEDIKIDAAVDSVLLVISGEPINETLVPYGPFLMNTKEEIVKAYEDFNNGKFSVLATSAMYIVFYMMYDVLGTLCS